LYASLTAILQQAKAPAPALEGSLDAIIQSFITILTDLAAGVVVLVIIVSGLLLASAGSSVRRAELGKHGLAFAIAGALVIALAHTTATYLLGFK
jgi:hypothetical protein